MLSTDSLRARAKVATTTRLNLSLPETNPPTADAKQLAAIQHRKIFLKKPLRAITGELGLARVARTCSGCGGLNLGILDETTLDLYQGRSNSRKVAAIVVVMPVRRTRHMHRVRRTAHRLPVPFREAAHILVLRVRCFAPSILPTSTKTTAHFVCQLCNDPEGCSRGPAAKPPN